MSQTKRAINLHNPGSLTEQELISGFVVRQKEFKSIFDDIKNSEWKNPEQHYIIQGPRGSGKTTLLYRIYYEIKNNKKLAKNVIPVMFNEEQYHIRKLYKLWESLCERLEDVEGFAGILDDFEERFEEEDFEARSFEIVTQALRKGKKKLVIFLDNIGDMLNKFNDQESARLREILLTTSDIRVIGASSVILEHNYDYSKPFFDFFKFTYLNELNTKESNKLLAHLGKVFEKPEIMRIIDEQPERIETLRRLTGGVVRTMALLFEIFVDVENGDSFKDLETALDRVTPLYKHRMDDLSGQQQEIVDAIAISWDAMTTKEVAKKIRMESKAVSSQLKQLGKNRIVEKVEQKGTKNHLYLIKERFFNIWYLMRCGRRRDKDRVKWLVRFLQSWCSNEELVERTKRHITALGKGGYYPKHAYYLSEALAQTELPGELQHQLLGQTKDFLGKKDKGLLKQLTASDRELFKNATDYYNQEKYEKCLRTFEKIVNKDGVVLFQFGALYHINIHDFKKAEEYYLKAVEKGHASAMYNLAILYETEFKDFKKAEEYYLKAVEKGYAGAMNNLALLYKTESKDFRKAEEYYLMAVEKGHADAMFNLAGLYRTEFKDFKKVEEYYLMAVEKGNANAMNNLAYLYFQQRKTRPKAVELSSRACSIEEKPAFLYTRSAVLLWDNQIPLALAQLEKLLIDREFIEHHTEEIGNLFMLLIAKKQYHSALSFFNREEANLRERLKPVYYALMHFMQDEYPNEVKKAGGEIKKTVEEIVERIKQIAIDYA